MSRPANQPTELLALCRSQGSLEALCDALRARGIAVDLVTDLIGMRATFLERGGHDGLILSPDLAPKIALTAARNLLDLDPDLRIVAFGADVAREDLPARVTRLTAHHPSSRAACGAVVRDLLKP